MIVKLPRHRPERKFSNAKRIILECSLIECVHCGAELALRRPRHMRKTIQTMAGVVFVAGKSKECTNSSCTHFGKHYYATGVLKYSLPDSTYGLDVLAFIVGQHEHEHQQLAEIRRLLNHRGVEINESNVGKQNPSISGAIGWNDGTYAGEISCYSRRTWWFNLGN